MGAGSRQEVMSRSDEQEKSSRGSGGRGTLLREVVPAEIGCCSARLAKKGELFLISWEKGIRVS